MPLDYLRQIAQEDLPLTVKHEAEIDKLRVLQAADLVSVVLSGNTADLQCARVLAITSKGRAALSLELEDPPHL